MKITQNIRLMAAVGIVFATLLLLTIIFYVTQGLLGLWEQLQTLPSWLFYLYSSFIVAITGGGGWMAWRFLRPKKPVSAESGEAPDEATLLKEMSEIEESGIDLASIRAELEQLHARKEAGQVHIAFFGDVSTGKSSIIKALIPDAEVAIDLRGGSTREIHEYRWQSSAEDRLLLTDLPGRNETEGTLDQMAQDEALRAQIVVYVTDSDLSRTQFDDIKLLYQFQKPMVLAINKSDMYTATEQQQLSEHISTRFEGSPPGVVFIQSGGEEEVIRISPDGTEESITRPRPVKVDPLAKALQHIIDNKMEMLEELRDVSVFSLVKHKLDQTKLDHRREQGEKIVRTSTRNAVIGAMAAMAPGTDIIIQGVIGTRMVQSLCKLYDSPVSQIDIDQFLDFSQGQLKKTLPLILAVIGNVMKAFPGIGTVAGGMVHAVAYGLIFDALGHSVLHTLEQRGELKAAPAAITFREMLSGNLEERTKTFAKMVVEHYKTNNKSKS